MHLYWRITEELKYLGEILVFHDPSLKRCYKNWVRRKSEALSMLEMDEEKKSSSFLRHMRGFYTMN